MATGKVSGLTPEGFWIHHTGEDGVKAVFVLTPFFGGGLKVKIQRCRRDPSNNDYDRWSQRLKATARRSAPGRHAAKLALRERLIQRTPASSRGVSFY